MKHFKYAVSFMMVLALALAFIGCANPPEAEKSAAKAAGDAAVAAGAEKYASEDFNVAKNLWNASEARMNEKKYEDAKQGYVTAKAAFEKAAASAAAGKKAVTDEAIAAMTGLEEDWKNLETAAKGVEKKMKDKKDAWEADTKAFLDGLKSAKDMITTDPAGVKAKAGELKAIIDRWNTAFKELAAAPSEHKATEKKARATKKRNKRGKYSIQIRAYPETGKNAATEFVTELRKIHPDVHMERVYVRERGVWYRILVGHFENAEEASTYMKEKKVLKSYPGSFVQVTSE